MTKLSKNQKKRVEEIKRIAREKDFFSINHLYDGRVEIETKDRKKTYVLSSDRPQDRKLIPLF